jgi:cell wall-associated NlpC family hydrolase
MKLLWQALTLAVLTAGCAAPPRDTVPSRLDPTAAPRARTEATPQVAVPALVATAETYLGVPYRYGGVSRDGLDCSGLVMSVYRKHDIQLPRTSAQQFRVGRPVAPSALRAGDLVFFANGRGRVNHVGIYAGQGRFIHASTSRHAVRYDSLREGYFRDRFAGARRVVTTVAR